MCFELSDEQLEIQRGARDFASRVFDVDLITKLKKEEQFPHELLKKVAETGYIGVGCPETVGGLDCGLLETVLIIEELCRADSSIGLALSSVDLGTELIGWFGSEQQKDRYLPPVIDGSHIACLVCSPLGGRTSFEISKASDGSLVLNGQMDGFRNGSVAAYFIVCCRKGPGVQDKDQSEEETFVLVDRNQAGVVMEDTLGTLGLRLQPYDNIAFENVKVDLSQEGLLRDESKGMSPLEAAQNVLMLRTAAQALGIAQGAYDLAVAYAEEREQFGQKIGQFQGIRHKIVDMFIKIEGVRAQLYSCAAAFDKGGLDRGRAIGLSLAAEKAGNEITDEALQIFGGIGYMTEVPVEHFYRDARSLSLTTGRRLSRKDVIAQSLLTGI